MNATDLNALLREDSLFATMPPALRDAVSRTGRVRQVRGGALVCRQGDHADRLIIALTTTLQLSLVASDGVVQSLGRLGLRRALNLGAVLRGTYFDYTANAELEGLLYEASADVLRRSLEDHPEYKRYLERITARPSIRGLVHVLRAGGVPANAIQRLVTSLEERAFVEGEILLAPELADTPWVLLDNGRCDLAVERHGARVKLASLEAGDFYGGSNILMRMRAVDLRATCAGSAFFLPAETLRELAHEFPSFRLALGREKPELVRKLRRALIERGDQLTKVLALPPGLPTLDAQPGGGIASIELEKTALGEPWTPGTAKARRLEGPLVTVVEDCGAAALAVLFTSFGRDVTVSEVRRRLGREPASFLDLGLVAEREGLSSHASRLTKIVTLRRLDLPLIAAIGPRYVVIHEVRGNLVFLFDPLSGLRQTTFHQLKNCFSGSVLTFFDVRAFLKSAAPSISAEKARTVNPQSRRALAWASRLRFMRLIVGEKRLLFGAFFVSLALLLLGVIAPKLSGLIVDDVLVHSDHALLVVIITGMLLVNGSQFLLEGAKQLGFSYLAGLLDYRLSSLVYRQSLGVDAATHERDRIGSITALMGELQRIRQSISTDLVEIFLQVAQGLVFAAILFSYSARIGVIALLVGPLGYAVLRIGGVRLRALYDRLFDQTVRSQSETAEQIESIATIKAVSGAQAARNRWEATFVEGVDLQRGLLHTASVVRAALQLVQELAQYAGLYLAVKMVLAHEMSPGEVLTVTMYLSGALQPLFGLAQKLDELEQLGVSFEKVDGLLQRPLEDEGDAARQAELELEGNISVRDLWYRYPGDGPDVLKSLSFEVKKGQTVAIVGRSGSGKTTLARLIQGAIRSSKGEIFFDETAASGMSVGMIRRSVGIVLQESLLFAGSITDNIAYGDDRPDEARVREAARLAAAHDFISRFPAGYRTYLAEGGLGLSGGQRQRVCLARALYLNPKILILDEATSSLDAESERAIMQNMREMLRGRTAIIIAQRLHTVKNADVILVIDKGEIVETGTHSTLIAGRGLYHALFSQQFNGS